MAFGDLGTLVKVIGKYPLFDNISDIIHCIVMILDQKGSLWRDLQNDMTLGDLDPQYLLEIWKSHRTLGDLDLWSRSKYLLKTGSFHF